MFVGRRQELSVLEDLYASKRFEMAVVYGRRRVGKTTLLDTFARGKNALFFTAQEESTALNLRRFSSLAYARFGIPTSTGAFATWLDALGFVSERASQTAEPLLFVFDEFPYAAATDPSLPSALQIAIDHGLKQTSACLVLCGSNEGFMESRVLGSKSPLFGRRTAQMRLGPLGYAEAVEMIPPGTPQEALRYYATFGGTPYYLEQIDAGMSYERNVARLFFNTSGLLYREPEMLLRQELREASLYNSVLTAVASGATTPLPIADKAGVPRASLNKYLTTLVDLGLLRREVPFGEKATSSRKGHYVVADPFFAFWYRFVAPTVEAVELGLGSAVAHELCEGQALPAYEGTQFERVCLQWLAHANRAGRLPFLATTLGRWWGTDPEAREQVDIDVVAANPQRRALLVGECKWRGSFDETEALRALDHRSHLLGKGWEDVHRCLFVKDDVSDGTRHKAEQDPHLHVVTAAELLEG